MTAENITRDNLNDFLVAYVDGELSAAEMCRVDDLLVDDPKARKLRDTLRGQTEMLKGLHRDILDLPVPGRLSDIITNRAGRVASPEAEIPTETTPAPDGGTRLRSVVDSEPRAESGRSPARLWLVAASVAFLVVGAAGGFLAGGRYGVAPVEQQDWLSQVAEYHAIYAREQRHLVEVAAEETPHIEAWLGKRLERTLVVPDLSAAGAVFKGGRLLGVNGQPVAQLIYQPADGEPIALCIMASGKADQSPVPLRRADLNMIEWRQDGYAYVVVGWEPEAELLGFAETAQKSLDL